MSTHSHPCNLCTAGRLQLQLGHYVAYLGGSLAQNSLAGKGGSAGSTWESPAPYPVEEQGDALAQSSIQTQSQVPGLCSTLGLLPCSHAGNFAARIPHTCCKTAKVHGIWRQKHNKIGSLCLEMGTFMSKIFWIYRCVQFYACKTVKVTRTSLNI